MIKNADKLKADLKKILQDKGNYKDSDMLMIDKLPFALWVIQEAEKSITDDGVIIENNKGEKRKNPAVEVHALYLNKVREYMQMLGLTPRERRKMEGMINDETDDFDDDE